MDIANDVDKWFETSAYDKNDNRPLPKGKNTKVIGKFEMNGNERKNYDRKLYCQG